MSVSEDSFQMPPPPSTNPAVERPAASCASTAHRAPQIPSKISLSRGGSLKLSRKNSDKVGRWTDDEHQLFLDGLEKHGKQWKTIATMIGTRTVVQVRTHAQKYFQKLERKTKSSSASIGSDDSLPEMTTLTSKRKQPLPQIMPQSDYQQRTRKMLKTESTYHASNKPTMPGNEKPRISITLSNIPSYTASRDTPTPTADMIPHMSAVSCSSSSENLSTISPAGVNELDLGLWGSAESNFYLEDSSYQDGVVDDPLQWFNLDAPDVPIFPDFQESLDTSLLSKTDSVVEALSHCMDPKVTVQSLFLHEQPLHM